MHLKAGIKDVTKDLCYYLGIPQFLLRYSHFLKSPKFLILNYHRVSQSFKQNGYLGISAGIFEQHVRFLRDNFKMVSMQDGLRLLYAGDSTESYATINLDDGYMDNYLHAYPVLKKYNVPATIFLITDFIGKDRIFWWDRVFNAVSSIKSGDVDIDMGTNIICSKLNEFSEKVKLANQINKILVNKYDDEKEQFITALEKRFAPIKEIAPCSMLGWKEIKEMNKNGIDFGSHAKTHSNLCLLKDNEALEELVHSKKVIEQSLGAENCDFCYPFGAFDERIKSLVQRAGFRCARSTLKGFNNRNSDRFTLASIGAESLSKASFFANRIAFTLRHEKR